VEITDLTALSGDGSDPFAVTHITILTKEEFKKLIVCAINSKFIPTDLKAELTDLKEWL
jgi:hypothetical protein